MLIELISLFFFTERRCSTTKNLIVIRLASLEHKIVYRRDELVLPSNTAISMIIKGYSRNARRLEMFSSLTSASTYSLL